MSLNIITNCTHAPIPFVNEISSPPTYTDTDDYILLYSFSDNCIQPDDGQIRNGRNM